MTHKIKNLLLAALFAVSPFAPLAQAVDSESAVKVLTNRSVALTASDINFGVIDQGVVYANAETISLDCDTDKGVVSYGSGAPADADASFTETDGQCGEIVVESGAEGFGYRLRVVMTAAPATDSSSNDPNTNDDTLASLTVYPQGAVNATPIISRIVAVNAHRDSVAQTIGANAEDKFDIGGNLTISRQVSGQYIGAYTVELRVCDNNPCTPPTSP